MKKRKKSGKTRESFLFFLFISPWLFGFVFLTLGPMIVSFFMSFTDWNLFLTPNPVGFANYIKLFTQDPLFWKTLKNTFFYTFMAVPINMFSGLCMAFLLNMKVKGQRLFRTLFYLPSVVPVVAAAMVFKWVLAPNTGLINRFLALFGITGPAWLLNERTVLLSFVFMAIWGVGGSMILLLSSMQGISDDLYEAAALDGAGRYGQFCRITIPMITPVIFFNLIMGIIQTLQTFSQIYILTQGGPNNASNMIVPYLYNNAFKYYRMGYASSIAWVLFIIILLFTLIVFKTSSFWVFYESEAKKK